MKRLLLVFTTILCINGFAQYDIEESDFASPGDTIVYAVDSGFTDPFNILGVIGDSLDWDFTALNVATLDTTVFYAPGDLPNGNSFPNADFGYWEGPLAMFMNKSTNSIKISGVSAPLSSMIDTSILDSTMLANLPNDVVFKYNNGGLLYLGLEAVWGSFDDGTTEGSFSFYYGDSLMGFQADSIRIREVVNYESVVDGFGIIHIPDGDFYSIRQNISYSRSLKIDVGVVLPFVGVIWFSDVVPIPFDITQHSYRWFVENARFPVVEINTDSAQTFLVSKFQIQPPASQVGITKNVMEYDWHLFSFAGNILIQSDDVIKNIDIVDITGRKVFSQAGINRNSVEIPFADNGLYLITVETEKGRGTRKLIR